MTRCRWKTCRQQIQRTRTERHKRQKQYCFLKKEEKTQEDETHETKKTARNNLSLHKTWSFLLFRQENRPTSRLLVTWSFMSSVIFFLWKEDRPRLCHLLTLGEWIPPPFSGPYVFRMSFLELLFMQFRLLPLILKTNHHLVVHYLPRMFEEANADSRGITSLVSSVWLALT